MDFVKFSDWHNRYTACGENKEILGLKGLLMYGNWVNFEIVLLRFE